MDNPRLLENVCSPDAVNLKGASKKFHSVLVLLFANVLKLLFWVTLKAMGSLLAIPVHTRGDEIDIQSRGHGSKKLFHDMLDRLLEIAGRNENFYGQHVSSVYASLQSDDEGDVRAFGENILHIPGSTRMVHHRGRTQAECIRAMSTKDLVFRPGPAGRGRSYPATVHVLDKPKNTAAEQMKMFLARLREGTGELAQADLPRHRTSGFEDATEISESVDETAVFHFSSMDAVRHSLVRKVG